MGWYKQLLDCRSGSEEKVLLKNSDGVVSGSSQVVLNDGWVTDVRTQLDSVGVVRFIKFLQITQIQLM